MKASVKADTIGFPRSAPTNLACHNKYSFVLR